MTAAFRADERLCPFFIGCGVIGVPALVLFAFLDAPTSAATER